MISLIVELNYELYADFQDCFFKGFLQVSGSKEKYTDHHPWFFYMEVLYLPSA